MLTLALPVHGLDTASAHTSEAIPASALALPTSNDAPTVLPAQDPGDDDDLTSPGAGDPDNSATSTFAVSTRIAMDYPLDDGTDITQREYVYDYICNYPETIESPEVTGTVTTKGDGKPVLADVELPLAIICTITPRASSFAHEYYKHYPTDPSITVEIAKPYIIRADFEHGYQLQGNRFTISVMVDGPRAARKKRYAFTYECVHDGVTLRGDNWPRVIYASPKRRASKESPSMPPGTECTITQDLTQAQIDGYRLEDLGPQTVTIRPGKTPLNVMFYNKYVPRDRGSSSLSPQDTPEHEE